MRKHHKILSLIYKFLNFFLKKNENQFRVIMYHDVQTKDLQNFKNQLIELKKKWKFIKPEELDIFSKTKSTITGKNILLTFDDGYKSMLNVNKILNELEISAIFFVISDFVNLSKRDNPTNFVHKNIDPDISPNQIYENLNWKDLQYLLEEGHTIGAHTKSHKRLTDINDIELLKEEIINSSIEIEKKLNIKVKHFAYSYGDINSFNQKSFNIAKSKFEYIFSGVRGNNSNLRFDKNIIRRDSIEPSFTINLINFFLEGFIDFKYNMENQKLDKWTN